MGVTYLNASYESRKGVGHTMSYKFPINIEVVFTGGYAESRDVDWDM
jgi:hypothetical protein